MFALQRQRPAQGKTREGVAAVQIDPAPGQRDGLVLDRAGIGHIAAEDLEEACLLGARIGERETGIEIDR